MLVSEFTFSPGTVTFDPYGTGTTICGDVDATGAGVLDLPGRSVVETPDHLSLNPGTARFSFGARIALTRGVGAWNVMQKGSWGDRQWKLSIHPVGGAAPFSCRVSGSTGILRVFTSGAVVAADGAWHQVVCARVGNEVQVRLDGAIVARGTGPTGSVSSTKSYLVGSKGSGTLSDPDQYLGLLDDAFVQVDLRTGVAEPELLPVEGEATAVVETEPVLHSGDAAERTKAAGHRTPIATSTAGAWAVSLWSNKSSLTSGWTAPTEVAGCQYQGSAGSGRITPLAADSGGPVGTLSYGGLTAVASQAGTMATMWTVVLNPR